MTSALSLLPKDIKPLIDIRDWRMTAERAKGTRSRRELISIPRASPRIGQKWDNRNMSE